MPTPTAARIRSAEERLGRLEADLKWIVQRVAELTDPATGEIVLPTDDDE